MDQVGECKLPYPHPEFHGSSQTTTGSFSYQPHSNWFLVWRLFSCWELLEWSITPSRVLYLDLWNSWHIANRSFMEAWLLNPCLVPKPTNSIPFSLTPSRKSKQSLEVPYRKLNLCGTRKSSTASQVASMDGGMIYSVFLFRLCFRVLFCIFQNMKF